MNDAKDPCECIHQFSAHTRDVSGAKVMRVDDALLGKSKGHDILSGKSAGESGCTECTCRQWIPANY